MSAKRASGGYFSELNRKFLRLNIKNIEFLDPGHFAVSATNFRKSQLNFKAQITCSTTPTLPEVAKIDFNFKFSN